MNFKFSKNQSVRAAVELAWVTGDCGDIAKDTRGTVKAHRNAGGKNEYLVKFRGHEHWVSVREDQLTKV